MAVNHRVGGSNPSRGAIFRHPCGRKPAGVMPPASSAAPYSAAIQLTPTARAPRAPSSQATPIQSAAAHPDGRCCNCAPSAAPEHGYAVPPGLATPSAGASAAGVNFIECLQLGGKAQLIVLRRHGFVRIQAAGYCPGALPKVSVGFNRNNGFHPTASSRQIRSDGLRFFRHLLTPYPSVPLAVRLLNLIVSS